MRPPSASNNFLQPESKGTDIIYTQKAHQTTRNTLIINMADQINDNTAAQTAKDNIPTQSNPMDNIHGNVEDISNKASGYKVCSIWLSGVSPR